MTINLELPHDLLGAINVSETGLAPRLKELIAFELFRERLISLGKGAELLGLSNVEFIQFLARHSIDYFTESPEELVAEVAALEQLLIGNG